MSTSTQNIPAATGRDSTQRIAATGSVVGAIVASSCCIVPLLLVTLGVSGAWIANLTALEPYKPWFVAVTVVFLLLGYWQAFFKPRKVCAAGSYCASPASGRLVKSALVMATILVFLAASVDYWAPWFY